MARRQLLALGIGTGAIEHRLRIGTVHIIYCGVYAYGNPVLSEHGRFMAAVLACGPATLISHFAAAVLWGIEDRRVGRIDVSTTDRGRAAQVGLHLHRVRSMHEEDRALVDGIPVTSVARTLLDLASMLRRQRVERAFDEAMRRGLVERDSVIRLCDRSRGRRGVALLRRVADDRYRPKRGSRSPMESRFAGRCRDSGLPQPEQNAIVEGIEVDAVWRDQGLVVELDSFEFHRTRSEFDRDHQNTLLLQERGWDVLRVTSPDLDGGWDRTCGLIRAKLGISR